MLGTTDNFFHPWSYDVKSKLKGIGEVNSLSIVFTPIHAKNAEIKKNMEPKTLPENWAYSRKPAFHYGWDWGPRLVTYGICLPVYLRGFS